MAKKRDDEGRLKKVLSELLWMKGDNKEVTSALVGKIQRTKRLRHQSIENLVNNL